MTLLILLSDQSLDLGRSRSGRYRGVTRRRHDLQRVAGIFNLSFTMQMIYSWIRHSDRGAG